MIKKILAAIDGSPRSTAALRKASALSTALGGSLGVLHVMEAGKPMLLQDDFTGKWLHFLSEKVAGRFLLQLETGNPAEAICDAAEKGDYDLIVMGSRGLGDAYGMILGSVSHGVLQRSHVPVLIVGAPAEKTGEEPDARPFKTILVPVDGTSRSKLIAIEAASLAVRLSSSLILLHVVPSQDYPLYSVGLLELGASAEAFDGIREELTANGEKILEETKAAVSAFPVAVKTRLESGDDAALIDNVAREENAGLIVMGSSGAGDLASFIFGGAAHRALEDAPCPILFIGEMKPLETAASR